MQEWLIMMADPYTEIVEILPSRAYADQFYWYCGETPPCKQINCFYFTIDNVSAT